jgi:tetratricopeptide (TPR) repeat protein
MVRPVSCIIILFTVSFSSFSNNRAAKKLLKQAYYFYDYSNYGYALPYFEQYIAAGGSESQAIFDAAECYFYARRDKSESAALYEASKSLHPLALLRLGEIYHLQGNLELAASRYESYLATQPRSRATDSLVASRLKQIGRAASAMASGTGAELLKLPDSINTAYPDYGPVLTPCGKYMFFTSRRPGSTGGLTDPNGEYFEDIYWSENIGGRWMPAANIGPPINSATHDACLAVSHDMSKMYIYRTNADGTGGNIYEAEYDGTNWSRPVIMEADFNLPQKGVKVTSIAISPGGSDFYYASNRPGTAGKLDIYHVTRHGANFWSRPKNLGAQVNTPSDEDCPYLHYDGKSLYFSSKGHGSIGHYDIYRTVKLADGTWSPAANMGYPINTTADNRGFVLMPDGVTAYISSAAANGVHDIYEIRMPAKNAEYSIIQGQLISVSGNSIRGCMIQLAGSGQQVPPNVLSGGFVLLSSPMQEYLLQAVCNGELVYSAPVVSPPAPGASSSYYIIEID